VAVMLYDPRKSNISKIERESGVKFEHISAPQQADIAKAAGAGAGAMITQVSDRYANFYVIYVGYYFVFVGFRC
jgi:ATP-dependent RNA helicase DDX21